MVTFKPAVISARLSIKNEYQVQELLMYNASHTSYVNETISIEPETGSIPYTAKYVLQCEARESEFGRNESMFGYDLLILFYAYSDLPVAYRHKKVNCDPARTSVVHSRLLFLLPMTSATKLSACKCKMSVYPVIPE